MISQLSFFPDPEPKAAAIEDIDPQEPHHGSLISEAEFDRVYGTTDPLEYAGLFPGVIISEGVPIDLAEIEEAKRVEQRRQDAEHKTTARWQCEEKHRKAVADAKRIDEKRRLNAELAAKERQRTALERRAAMGRRGAST